MSPSQNMLKMSTVSPDTSREMSVPLGDGCNNNWLVYFLHSTDTDSLCFISARRRHYVSGKGLTLALVGSCVL